MECIVELEQELDGRWIAEVPALPGALVYALSPAGASIAVLVLTTLILAERQGRGELAGQFSAAELTVKPGRLFGK